MQPKYSATLAVMSALLGAALVEGVAIASGVEGQLPSAVQTANPNHGFSVQSGFEGYLVSPPKSSSAAHWLAPAKIGFLKGLLLPVASFLFVYGAKVLSMGLHLVLALFLGVATTTAVCSFTPLCTISLNAPGLSFFKGQSVRDQVADLARIYMTPENMEMASKFVQSALDKYAVPPRREADKPAETTEPSVQENEAIPSI